MIEEIPALQEPQWLAGIDKNNIEDRPIPLAGILNDSLYYPASGFDGDPVRWLAGNVLSFVYVDYAVDRGAFKQALERPGFRGYEVLGTRDVEQHELTFQRWRPPRLIPSDGNPLKYRECVTAPFCIWTVFQKSEQTPAIHGPRRFSLLYLCADGVAAFEALYVSNTMKPRIVAVIQPGHGFGRNWTDFTKQDLVLGRTVLGNPAGAPQFLLYGGIGKQKFYQDSCWPDLPRPVAFTSKTGGGSIGLFGGPTRRGA